MEFIFFDENLLWIWLHFHQICLTFLLLVPFCQKEEEIKIIMFRKMVLLWFFGGRFAIDSFFSRDLKKFQVLQYLAWKNFELGNMIWGLKNLVGSCSVIKSCEILTIREGGLIFPHLIILNTVRQVSIYYSWYCEKREFLWVSWGKV